MRFTQEAARKAKPLAHDVAEKLRACERECQWLREELDRLELIPADSPRAARLQKRLGRYHREWLTFLEHPALAPTNNCAEQALRALVILRKLTFGSRTLAGARPLAAAPRAEQSRTRVFRFIRQKHSSVFRKPARG